MRKDLVAGPLLALCAVGIAATQAQQRPEEPPLENSNGENLEIPEFAPDPRNPERWMEWARGSYFEDSFGGVDRTRVERYLSRHHYLTLKALHDEALTAFNNGTEPPDCRAQSNLRGQGWHDPDFPEPPSSVEQIVDRAAIVAMGIVMEIETGFVGLRGGSMLLVQLDSFASRHGYEEREQMLVFWPFGEIRIGHATVCASSDDFPPAPSVGDRIMLFPQYELYDDDFWFVHVDVDASGGAAIYSNTGGLVIPGSLSRFVPNVAFAGSFTALNEIFQVAIRRSALR